MPKKETVYIDGVEYNKKSFEEYWRLLSAQRIGTRFSGKDHRFLQQAASRNGAWEKVMARGPNYYFKPVLKKFHGRKVRGIALISPNSSREIWIGKARVIDAVFPKPQTPESIHKENKKLALQALRQIIEPQMSGFRRSIKRQIKNKNGPKIRCAITKESLDHGEFHIDHAYPFKNIVEDWCRESRVDLESLEVACRGTKCYLKNTNLAESFFDYHLMVAKLQPTTAAANLRKGATYGAPVDVSVKSSVQEDHSTSLEPQPPQVSLDESESNRVDIQQV
jgi:hypothetical protein